MKNLFAASVAVGVLSAGVCASASAALVYEGFDYTAGASLAGQNGGLPGFGTGAAWFNTNGSIAVGSSTLTYSDGSSSLIVSGNSASVPATASFNQSLRDTVSTYDSGEVWVSWLLKPNDPAVGYSQFVIRQSGADGGGALVALGNDSNTTDLYFEVNGARVPLSTGFQLASDETYFFAVNISYNDTGDETINVYANSDLDAPTNLIGSATASLGAVGRFSILAGSNGTPSGNTEFDEIRLGTTFAEVAPIPEPASLTLLALGGLAVAGGRRRRATA